MQIIWGLKVNTMPDEVIEDDKSGGATEDISDPVNVMHASQSSLVMKAGRDIPFAEGINLMGQLEADYFVVSEYEKSVMENRKNRLKKDKRGRHKVSGSTSITAEQEEAQEDKARQYIEKERELVPFVLPQLGLETLLKATKNIYETAMGYYNVHHPPSQREVGDEEDDAAKFISQDDLFPIILYCVIQSKLENPHRFIHFVEHILPKTKTTMGQGAFALTALKATVQYISNTKPTAFGMDDGIEDE